MKVISRRDAIRAGLNQYFTGRPCRNGHVSLYAVKGGCIECSRARARQWKIEHPERRKASQEEWRAKNRNRDLESKRRWRMERLEWAREYNRKRYDPIKQRAYYEAWYEKNAEKAKDNVRRWKQDNPERARTNHHRRRARQKGAQGSHVTSDIEDIRKAQRGRCAYCRTELTARNTHRDHIQPLSKGGTNDRRNIQLLCSSCNVRKHDSDPLDYARKLGRLV